METPRIIFEDFKSLTVSPGEMDRLLADGWRHAGLQFYRYNFAFHQGMLTEVIPLRIDLTRHRLSKSQRRNWRRNQTQNYRVIIRPTVIDEEKQELFERHKRKFEENVPDSLYDFLSPSPDRCPCEGGEVCLYESRRLLGVSFFDVGAESLSTIYGMYDLDYGKRGLGIYTMLLEMEHARRLGKRFYYHGYCYRCPSFYDYKKRFHGLEAYDWCGGWHRWRAAIAGEAF